MDIKDRELPNDEETFFNNNIDNSNSIDEIVKPSSKHQKKIYLPSRRM